MELKLVDPVVVGFADVATAAAAMDLAAAEADRRGADLAIVYWPADTRRGGRCSERAVTASVKRVRAEHPTLTVIRTIAAADLTAALVECSGASLVVLGYARIRRGAAPQLAARVAAASGRPVLVPGTGDTLGGPVVVGLVGAVPAERAVEFAFGEAELRGVPLVALSVGPARQDHDTVDPVERWAEKYPHVPVTRTARRALDAVVTLAAAARSAALVVVAAPADRLAAQVTESLLHRAVSPVALVPDDRATAPDSPQGTWTCGDADPGTAQTAAAITGATGAATATGSASPLSGSKK